MTDTLQDLEVVLANRPGTLAEVCATLATAGVNLEGGGVFSTGRDAVAHYLVSDADTARHALAQAGHAAVVVHDVVMLRLDQETPG